MDPAVFSDTPFAVSLSTGFSLLPETALEMYCSILKKADWGGFTVVRRIGIIGDSHVMIGIIGG
jgi:hypothetical protein